jgi:dTDP-4-amino-4,6-dideoxygalactose transaminase
MGTFVAVAYPILLHLQKLYKHPRCKSGDFHVTESVGAEIVSLSMFPRLPYSQQK